MGRTATELRTDIERRRADLTEDFEALGDRVSPSRAVERRTEAVKSSFRSARERVMGAADDAGGAAREHAHDTRDTLYDAAHTVSDTVQGVPDAVRHQAQGNPLAAGLVAFGLGVLAATVLPGTRREQQLARQVQPHLEQAASAVGSVAGGMVDDLAPEVQGAVDELTSSAQDAAQRVANEAKGAATAVGEQAKGAAVNVKEDVQDATR